VENTLGGQQRIIGFFPKLEFILKIFILDCIKAIIYNTKKKIRGDK